MIRPFQPGDASPCCDLIDACLDEDPSYSPALLRKIRNIETPENMMERARLFYVAVYESGGRILGVTGLDLNEIRLMHVSPEHRRQGIGRRLLEHIIGMVPPDLFADIFVYSSLRASDFYRACGFVDRGPFAFNLDGEVLQTVFMAFPLSPSPSR